MLHDAASLLTFRYFEVWLGPDAPTERPCSVPPSTCVVRFDPPTRPLLAWEVSSGPRALAHEEDILRLQVLPRAAWSLAVFEHSV